LIDPDPSGVRGSTTIRKEAGVSEHEHRSEEEVLAEQQADAVEDLEVPEGQQDDVAGGGNKTGDIILK